MRRLVAAVVLAAALLSGCDAETPEGPREAVPAIAVDTTELQRLKQQAGIEPCAPGPGDGALPQVTLHCLGGGDPVDLSTLRGPMVVNLWAHWCGPCKTEMPILQEFHTTYGDQVDVLGVDYMDGNPDVALQQAEKRGVTYPQLVDQEGVLREYAEFERASGLPFLGFVDADGAMAGVHVGGVKTLEELVGLVEQHLGVSLG